MDDREKKFRELLNKAGKEYNENREIYPFDEKKIAPFAENMR